MIHDLNSSLHTSALKEQAEVKIMTEQAMKARNGSGGTAILFL
jgi:hypothetical protein